MKIGSIFQAKINSNFKANKTNSNPFNKYQANDSVSFSGKNTARRALALGLTPFAFGVTVGQDMPVADVFVISAQALENTNSTTVAPAFNALLISNTKLNENNDFQLAQTKDCPSITFDFTNNFKAWKNEPIASSIVLTTKPNKDHIEEFRNLSDVLVDVCGIDLNDTEEVHNKMIEIVRANPWMLEHVKAGIVDYSKGHVLNVDPQILLNTDFAASFGEAKRIFIPTSYVTAERRNDYDTTMIGATSFIPARANEDGDLIIELRDSDISKAWKDDAKIAIVNKRLAKEYGIPTMESWAGIGIWHAIATDKDNYEIFANYSEEDAQTALLNYIKENDVVSLTLPRVDISVMVDEENEDLTLDILTQKTDLGVVISYLSPDRAVYDVSDNADKTIRPIDVLDTVHFTNGDSLKQAYEENPDKYEGYVLSAWQQQINNNNALIEYYTDSELEVEDLYEEINLDAIGAEGKINLQRVAIAHPNCQLTCEKPVKTTPKVPQETTPPTETNPPTDPTSPTETEPPTEPTPPTETEPPTEPTPPTECPDLPEIGDREDETLPTDPGVLKPRPTEGPSEETTPPSEEAPCPTEGHQPDSGYDNGSADDFEIGFETTQPQTPPATQPQTPCPTEGHQPDSGYDYGSADDFVADFASNSNTSSAKDSAPAPTQASVSQSTGSKETSSSNGGVIASDKPVSQPAKEESSKPAAQEAPVAKEAPAAKEAPVTKEDNAQAEDFEISF